MPVSDLHGRRSRQSHLGLPRLGDVQQKYVPQNMIKKWRERFNMTIENTGAGRGSIFVPSLG